MPQLAGRSQIPPARSHYGRPTTAVGQSVVLRHATPHGLPHAHRLMRCLAVPRLHPNRRWPLQRCRTARPLRFLLHRPCKLGHREFRRQRARSGFGDGVHFSVAGCPPPPRHPFRAWLQKSVHADRLHARWPWPQCAYEGRRCGPWQLVCRRSGRPDCASWRRAPRAPPSPSGDGHHVDQASVARVSCRRRHASQAPGGAPELQRRQPGHPPRPGGRGQPAAPQAKGLAHELCTPLHARRCPWHRAPCCSKRSPSRT
jgi:hypothetical protein